MFLQLKKVWHALSHGISFVMSSIVLTMLWMTLFAFYAIVLKIVRFFARPNKLQTYWTEVSEKEQGNMAQQF